MSNETGTNTVNDDGEVARNDTKQRTNESTKENAEKTKDNTEKSENATEKTKDNTEKAESATEKTKDGKEKPENPKQGKENKPRSVSFNRDIHVKRFGKPRPSRGGSTDQSSSVRKEPFTNLSQEELIEEANRVLAQAQSVTCTADHPPEKFFSLPHRRKFNERAGRRNSEDIIPDKTPLGRSTSDVSTRKRKERTSLSTLFRRQQRNKSPDNPVKVSTKPIAVVKRSKSDVTDLKSNTTLSTQTKPIRKRSGSETEEFLKSLRNKKSQLSPIIESSPREDYFKNTPPLEVFEKQKLAQKDSKKSEKQDSNKVNPVEKPPRYNTPQKSEPKPPVRTKRGKSLSPPIDDTPKRKTEVKKTTLVDEIDSVSPKDINSVEVKDKIKESIRKIEENVYADNTMIHSSQRPPDKPPLTRGHTVGHMVRILREDQMSPPKSHLISSQNGTSVNQPFSYIKPSISPDANLFVRNSPDRIPTPVNKMTDKGVVYAEVLRDGDRNTNSHNKKYSPSREKYGPPSDEDEGLGYEERYKYTNKRDYDYDYKTKETETFNNIDGYKITDSPIRPRFREYRLTSFDELEPTYANEYPSPKEDSADFIDKFRGRGDGMDTKKKPYEPETAKLNLDFNELSHRRQLLESRLNARRFDRDRVVVDEPITRYLTETDPIYEAEKRMKATERYVNETVRYYRNTLERDGYTESSVTEDYNKYDSENQKIKYNTDTRTFEKVSKDELDRREFIDRLEPRYKDKSKEFPPEPEYEPPSLESNPAKPVLTPDEYKEKKYKAKKTLTSSHDALQTGQKYKVRDDYVDKRKGHYASNPEIAQEREEEYANLPKYSESYHNSLRRMKNKDRYKQEYGIRRHDSGDSRDYYDRSPSRFDNRLVDSGIENDFRKDSSGEIHTRHRKYESDDDANNVSMFLDNERRHTEDNYPGEQIYANTEYMKYKNYREDGYKKEYNSRERSADDGSRYDPKLERYEKSPSRLDDKISAKPPKAKKLSGLEKMKQLFSRDSSKKSKKEKAVQPQARTRVLKSPEHLAGDDSDYRRYTDPEPSDIVVRKINYDCQADERRIRGSREELDPYRNPDNRYNRSPDDRYKAPDDRYKTPDDGYRSPDNRDSDIERKYREYDQRVENRYTDRVVKGERRYQERREEKRRNHSSERESDARPSDGESELRKSRSRPTKPDSPALAERYRGRRRLATPSPTPSPPRRPPAPTGWFKSLDRLTRKNKNGPTTKVEQETIITPEDERKSWPKKPLNSPAKNLRFFGDTDPDSDAHSHSTVVKSKSHPHDKGTLRKTMSNSSNGLDEVDASLLSSKSYSLSNLHRTDQTRVEDREPRNASTKQFYKRNLQNISEIQSNSETESQLDRKMTSKPPISPYDRSRSHSSSKTLKAERKSGERTIDTRRKEDRGSSTEVRRRVEDRGNSNDVRRRVEERGSSTDNRRRIEDRGSSTDVRRRVEDRGSSTDIRRRGEERGSSTDIRRRVEDRGSSTDIRRRVEDRDSANDVRRRTEDRGSSSELRSSKQELNRDLKHRRRTPATNSGESSTEGDSSHQSQRSVVYLHATTVGDIPDPGRLTRNRSRDDVSSVNSSSIQVRSTTKSFSIFAPWTPKHYSDQTDVHYAQKPRKTKKEPAKTDRPATLQKNKSYSQTTLTRKPTNNRLTSSSQTLYRKPEKRKDPPTLRKSVTRDGKKSQSSEIISRDSDRERVSRSVSMPKNNEKKAGWFKLTSKKKPEVNSRVR